MLILDRETIPAECIADCSEPGVDAHDAVEHWRRKLAFQIPRALAQRWLAESGGWSRAELALADNGTLWRRVLWLACCQLREGGDVVCIE